MSSAAWALFPEMSWEECYAVPGANVENKAFIEEILKKRKELSQLKSSRENHQEQRQLATEFLKQVEAELHNLEALCQAKDREADLETHLAAVAQREIGHLAQESARMRNELRSLAERKNALEVYPLPSVSLKISNGRRGGLSAASTFCLRRQGHVFKAKEKLQRFCAQMNWDQRATDAFLEESARKEDDVMAVVKYSQQDERRIKGLTLAIERTTLEANEKRKALDMQMAEHLSVQIALDQTTEHLQQAHRESDKIIQQWDNTIQQMKQRHGEIHGSALKVAETNRLIRGRNAALTETKHLYDSQMNDNKQNERKLTAANRQAAKLRQELKEREKNYLELKDEEKSCKTSLDKTASTVESVKSHMARLKDQVQKTNVKLEQTLSQNSALEEKLKAATHDALSDKEKAAQMEHFLTDEEQAIKELDVQLRDCREELFRCKQHVVNLKRMEKDSLAQELWSKSTIGALERKIGKQEKHLRRQRMIRSEQDFRVVFLEKKLARLQGVHRSDEKQVLETKMAQLSKALDDMMKTSGEIGNAVKESQGDIRYLRKENDKSAAEKEELVRKVEELKLINKNSEKELKRRGLQKQERLVERNLFKLEVTRKRELAFNKADGVLSLEKRQLNVKKAIRGRQEEIQIYGQMLSQELKTTEQERQKISADLNRKLSQIHAVKKHFQVVTFSMATTPGEEEEEEEEDALKCQAGYIAKAVLQRAELKEQAERLTARIGKALQENQALRNATLLFNVSNSEFHTAVAKAKESSPEYQEKIGMEEQLRLLEGTLKYKRRQVGELQQDQLELNNTLDSLLRAKQAENRKMEHTQSLISKLNGEVASQQEKMNRATKQCWKLAQKIRRSRNTKSETLEEKDVKLRRLKDLDRSINKMLNEVTPELRSLLEKFFLQTKWSFPSPPSTPGSRRSSETNSAGMSTSARSSASSASRRRRSSASAPASCFVKTVALSLDLPVPSPPFSVSRGSSSASSNLKNP